MAKLKLDFRPILRSIANRAQDENLERLLSGETVSGSSLAPRSDIREVGGRAKRVRLFGIRVSVRELAGKIGVRTGAMLRDITRRANVKLGRVSFHIVPSAAVRMRWFAFVKGATNQPPRPISGMSGELIDEAKREISAEARDQFVQAANSRSRR